MPVLASKTLTPGSSRIVVSRETRERHLTPPAHRRQSRPASKRSGLLRTSSLCRDSWLVESGDGPVPYFRLSVGRTVAQSRPESRRAPCCSNRVLSASHPMGWWPGIVHAVGLFGANGAEVSKTQVACTTERCWSVASLWACPKTPQPRNTLAFLPAARQSASRPREPLQVLAPIVHKIGWLDKALLPFGATSFNHINIPGHYYIHCPGQQHRRPRYQLRL